jgi:hypothetical protein
MRMRVKAPIEDTSRHRPHGDIDSALRGELANTCENNHFKTAMELFFDQSTRNTWVGLSSPNGDALYGPFCRGMKIDADILLGRCRRGAACARGNNETYFGVDYALEGPGDHRIHRPSLDSLVLRRASFGSSSCQAIRYTVFGPTHGKTSGKLRCLSTHGWARSFGLCRSIYGHRGNADDRMFVEHFGGLVLLRHEMSLVTCGAMMRARLLLE